MNSYISILGLYSYDGTIFDDMVLPEGMDHNMAVDEILLRCADLELLYPDADFMKYAISHWSKANSYNFAKMFNTTQLEYNPIWNKDGQIIEETDTTGDGTSTGSSKGFNSDNWAEGIRNQDQTAGHGKTVRTEQGNIGVTTTQQMIREERDISEFNIYGYIADRFKSEFCLLVY